MSNIQSYEKLEQKVKELEIIVAEYKRTDEALKKSAIIIDSTSDAVITTTIDGEITFWNMGAERIYGYRKEEVIGKPISIIYKDEDLHILNSMIGELLAGKSIPSLEVTCIGKDHNDINILLSLTVIKDRDNNITELVGITKDITERKRAEEALRESEERFHLLSEASFAGIAITDKGIILDVNKQFAERFGYQHDELIGMEIMNLVAPGSRDVVSQNIRSGYQEPYEHLAIKKDGSVVQVEVHGRTIPYEGRMVRVTAIHDITERKRAVELLKKSEERYRFLIENIPSVTWVTNEQGETSFISHNIEKIYGFSNKEIYEKGAALWFKRIHPDDEGRVRESFKMLFAKGLDFDVEYRIQRKDGEWIWIHDTSILSYEEDGKKYAYGIFSDITKRKRAEDALKESEKLYRHLFDQANEGLILMAHDRKIHSVNQAFVEMHGYSVDELKRMDIRDLDVLKERLLEVHADIIRRIEAGETVRFETEHYHKDGHIFPLSVTSSIIDMEGQRYFLAFHQDITERKQAEARLQQAQKLESIGTLAGGIAHDFNNLLFPVLGFAEMLKDDCPADSPMQFSIDGIIRAALRSKELIKQILAVSRMGEPNVKPIRLQPIVKEAVDLLRASIPATIDIQREIDPQCGIVMAEPTQIHQVVMNLATNAYHAMGDTGGRLDVTLRQVAMTSEPDSLQILTPGNYALLSVSDTGTGIEKEILGRIFDPYFTTKGVGKGTGLGLSVVLGIVKSHKGDIRISSQPGKGTCVRVYLPVMTHSTEHIIAENVGSDPVGTEKILLVDDEVSIIHMEQQMLERLGYRVTSHTGSNNALEAFKANPGAFDLVLTDMMMPNMTGVQLAKELTSIRPDIPIIICTGLSEMLNDERTKSNGIKGVLMKPVVKSNMAHAVREALDEAKKGTAQGTNHNHRTFR